MRDWAAERRTDQAARLVYVDYWLERGRDDIARLWYGPYPPDPSRKPRIIVIPQGAESKLEAWVEEHKAYGLSTQPADRDLFEASIFGLYSVAHPLAQCKVPKIRWVANPVEVAEAASGAAGFSSSGQPLDRDSLVLGQIDLSAAIEGATGSDVRRYMFDAVQYPIWRAIENANYVINTRTRPVTDFVFEGLVFEGQFRIHTPAYYLAYIDVLGLQIEPRLEYYLRAWMGTCRSASWWFPGKDLVVVSERPKRIEPRPPFVPRFVWDGFST
jgi:hypothetical protein